MQVLLANPRGFCAGVARAIDIVEHALRLYGPPVYVRHEIVHNRYVIAGLKARGVIFVDELHEIPDSGVAVFSAHGVAKSVNEEAKRRGLHVIDATCPLVTKVHRQVEKLCLADYEVVVIGHAGHPEVLGTMGQVRKHNDWRVHLVETAFDIDKLKINNPGKLGYVTQTTLSVDETREIIAALRACYPDIIAPATDDICYATQNRQDAVKALVRECEVILVVGSRASSNSNSLKTQVEKLGKPAYLIDEPDDIKIQWLDGWDRIGLTAGASAPDELIETIINRLEQYGATEIRELEGIKEDVHFRRPKFPQIDLQPVLEKKLQA